MLDIINDIQKKLENKYIEPNHSLRPNLWVIATKEEQRS